MMRRFFVSIAVDETITISKLLFVCNSKSVRTRLQHAKNLAKPTTTLKGEKSKRKLGVFAQVPNFFRKCLPWLERLQMNLVSFETKPETLFIKSSVRVAFVKIHKSVVW